MKPANPRDTARVMAVDPGLTCGWSTSWRSHGQIRDVQFLNSLWGQLVLGQIDRIVIERFQTRSLTPDSEQTLRVIGAIEWMAEWHNVPIGWVNPSDKRRFIGAVGHDIQGAHARDADAIRLWDLRYGDWS